MFKIKNNMQLNLSLGISLLVGFCFAPEIQAQQVIPDSSFNTIVQSSDNQNFTVTNGRTAGQNLFHSFQEFSIPTGGSATFDLINSPNIRTIFNRVTGGTVSNIDGLIRTINTTHPVSIFLLNPNGIIFGSNAQLNIGGSFTGTTASQIQFADGTLFDATQPPLLTVSVPVGLQFGQAPASITIAGSGHRLASENPVFAPYVPTQVHSGLAVPFGQSIALIGGELNFDGGIVTAPEGRIELAGVRQGFVGLNNGWQYDRVSEFGDVQLLNRSLIDVNGINSGSIQVHGRQITVRDGSAIWIQHRGMQTGGDLNVIASESVLVDGISPDFAIRSSILNETIGEGANGKTQISAPSIAVQAGGLIGGRNYRSLAGGTVDIKARSLNVSGYVEVVPDIFSVLGSLSFLTGNAGNVLIEARNISITAGGYLGTTTIGIGRSGDVTLNAQEILVSGTTPSLIGSVIAASSAGLGGNGGNLTINTQRIRVLESGLVSVSSIGEGSAGNVTVNASEFVEVRGKIPGTYGSAIASTIDYPNPSLQRLFGIPAIPKGNSGGVTINTPLLSMGEEGGVAVTNTGIGNAGTLKINTERLISRGGNIDAFTRSGSGGNIEVQAKLIQLREVSDLTATAQGTGDGGNIRINAPVILGLENSDIVANAIDGRGGNITITTQAILGLRNREALTSENDISASSRLGVNGTVQITAPDVDPNAGLVELPGSVLDAKQALSKGCSAIQENRFIITGRGGLPTNPLEQINGTRTWADLRSISPASVPVAPELAAPKMIEATTWQRNQQGQVELIAESEKQFTTQATCRQ